MDAKNYHAWSHRQWILRKFNCFENEMKFVELLIEEDIRNNSAWNQRHFVCDNTTGFTKQVIDRELRYTFDIVQRAPHNESPWNYLIGLMNKPNFSSWKELEEFALGVLAKTPKCDQAQMLLVDLYEKSKKLQQAALVCDDLMDSDKTRVNYWQFRKSEILDSVKAKGDSREGKSK